MKINKVSDIEIKGAFGDNFKSYSLQKKKKVLAECLLKIFCGYSDSAIATQITKRMNLMTKNGTITKRGKTFLMDFYYRST